VRQAIEEWVGKTLAVGSGL